MEKCRFCDNCEIRIKGKGSIIILDILVPNFGYWKWCRFHNNWCRYIAGNCKIKYVSELEQIPYF